MGLKTWGAQVLEDLWTDLEAETAKFLREAPKTWQEQDRWALDEFVEGRVRDFVGRTAITRKLADWATSPAADLAAWGTYVTSEPGGGKSSLFGHLYRKLLRDQDVLVLAHAVGISVQSSQVSRMLRRWIGELAALLGESDPTDERTAPDEIDQAFSRLLGRAAANCRVVVLVDALNQFEATPRATHLTWLPKLWPSRFIATAVPSAQSAALHARPGVDEETLPANDAVEAAEIVRKICERYHRTMNEQVINALLGKRREGGAPALGNPLWLELAAEELNLIEADVYEEAETRFSGAGSGADRIIRLLLSIVDRMPGSVEGLYEWMLDGAERRFGAAWTRSFVDAIALSRTGCRESDLEKVMPTLAGEPDGAWDPLRFATLRRGFRAHVVQRGAYAQWDFAHAQMRRAVERRIAQISGRTVAVHATLANHLLGLRRDDPLHETETTVHLLLAGNPVRAAEYYGEELTRGEVAGAADPGNAGWQRDLSISHGRIGDVLRAQGNLPGAVAALQASLAIAERLAAADPGNAGWQSDLVVSHYKLATCSTNADDSATRHHWRRCRAVLRHMKGSGMFLEPGLVQLLNQLDQAF